MTKRKNPAVEAFDKQGPATLAAGYTWCPECQASYQGEVCPGCKPESNQPDDEKALKGLDNVPPELACEGTHDKWCKIFFGAGCDCKPTTLAEVAEQSATEVTTITEILPVPLTDAEYKEFGILVSRANQEIAQAEDELKSVKSQYKSRIDSAEARRNEYAAIINAGHQQKSVECDLVKDFTENTITLVRLDTGEVVRTRTMTTAERQRGLFPPGPPPDPSCIDPTD